MIASNHWLYMIINSVNNKLYVGTTSGSLKKRWGQHKGATRGKNPRHVINIAMRKYGVENFTMVPLFAYPTRCSMLSAEEDVVELLDLRNRNNGYNVAKGGGHSPMWGRCHTEAALAKMSAAHKGWRPTLETRIRMSAASMGRSRSEASIEKTAASKRGVPRTDETRAKISAAKMGHRVAARTRQKISKTIHDIWGVRQGTDTILPISPVGIIAGPIERRLSQTFADGVFG